MLPVGMFRRSTLVRPSSPEQVDALMRVMRPGGWLVLWTTIALLLTAGIWGSCGRIPVRVSGQGVLLRGGGILRANAPNGGTITKVLVSKGDVVKKGAELVRIAQPDLEEQLSAARTQLAEAERQAVDNNALDQRAERLDTRTQSLQRDAAAARVKVLQTQLGEAQTALRRQQQLLTDGVITHDAFDAAQLSVEQTRGQLVAAQADLDRIDSENVRAGITRRTSLQERQAHLDAARQKVAGLEEQLQHEGSVFAVEGGRVVEVDVVEGDAVQSGEAVAGIERVGADGGLELIAYLSALDAYEVNSGMTVQVVPSVVKQEEYGSILGRVLDVADVPADPQDMLNVLGNQPLVTRLSTVGLPVEVRGRLTIDSRTPSGYRWTSSKGAPLRLHDGMLCDVSVIVSRRAPITFVIPGIERIIPSLASSKRNGA